MAVRNLRSWIRCGSFQLTWACACAIVSAQPGDLPPGGPDGPGGQAEAAPPGFGPPGGPGGFGPPRLPIMDAIDKDQDGQLNETELANAASALRSLDKNSDGALQSDEFMPAFRPGRGGPGGNREPVKVLERFDADHDGILNLDERSKARVYLKETAESRGGRGGFPGGGRRGGRGPGGFPGGPGGPGGMGESQEGKPGPHVSPGDVADFTGKPLYDPSVVRTLFFEFEESDWEKALEEFHDTDVDVPAKLTVDGKTYDLVGVRFRGMSSYGTVREGLKRSINVSIDLKNKKQSLGGFRTLNLLNAHVDPSFLRTVLFDEIAGTYAAAPRANHVQVVINGESWGIYVNEEQFNKDFAKSRFGESNGVRWNVPVNFSGESALVYHGDGLERYKSLYELKSKDEDRAWVDLRELCRLLHEDASDSNYAAIERILNVDQALWFLALDSVLSDEDGYFSRGSDYQMYQDGRFGRFYMILKDSNETFRKGGGGPGFRGNETDPEDPLAAIHDDQRPLAKKLFSNPIWRSRYLAHVRTLTEDWLAWDKMEPLVKARRDTIASLIEKDTRKLYSMEAFLNADQSNEDDEFERPRGPFGPPPGLRTFLEEREEYLHQHPALKEPAPEIKRVATIEKAGSTYVVAEIAGEVDVDQVLLYYSPDLLTPFATLAMADDGQHQDGMAKDGIYGVALPTVKGAKELRFYVEARATSDVGTTRFFPRNTERGALVASMTPPAPDASNAPENANPLPTTASPASGTSPLTVVISEIMATNTRTIADAKGQFEDWIELHNTGSEPVDLAGAYLSDDPAIPKKWMFPAGSLVAPRGYLMVWADDDSKEKDGLHANFKLSKKGETIVLTDTDERQNSVIDSLSFQGQQDDVAFGRLDGSTRPMPLSPTPGEANRAGEN